MDPGELHHLLFRWLHVTTAMMWIGHTWSLVFAQNTQPAKTDAWMRGWAWGTMISSHVPLIYGSSRPWLAAPSLVALGCAMGLSLRSLSLRGRRLEIA